MFIFFDGAEIYLYEKEFRNIFRKILKNEVNKEYFELDDEGLLEIGKNGEEIEIYVVFIKNKVGDRVRLLLDADDLGNGFGVTISEPEIKKAFDYIQNSYFADNN